MQIRKRVYLGRDLLRVSIASFRKSTQYLLSREEDRQAPVRRVVCLIGCRDATVVSSSFRSRNFSKGFHHRERVLISPFLTPFHPALARVSFHRLVLTASIGRNSIAIRRDRTKNAALGRVVPVPAVEYRSRSLDWQRSTTREN